MIYFINSLNTQTSRVTSFFLWKYQTSMSVQRIPLRVTRTQIAPTAKGLIAVHVNKDLLEMGQFVKVNQTF